MFVGRTTVATNSLVCVLACIGMCSLSPRVVPIRVAEVEFPAAVWELQLTANVVEVPGAEGLGVISTGDELASAACAETTRPGKASTGKARAATLIPAVAAARRTARMKVPPGALMG